MFTVSQENTVFFLAGKKKLVKSYSYSDPFKTRKIYNPIAFTSCYLKGLKQKGIKVLEQSKSFEQRSFQLWGVKYAFRKRAGMQAYRWRGYAVDTKLSNVSKYKSGGPSRDGMLEIADALNTSHL